MRSLFSSRCFVSRGLTRTRVCCPPYGFQCLTIFNVQCSTMPAVHFTACWCRLPASTSADVWCVRTQVRSGPAPRRLVSRNRSWWWLSSRTPPRTTVTRPVALCLCVFQSWWWPSSRTPPRTTVTRPVALCLCVPELVVAQFPYTAQNDDELTFHADDVITVVNKVSRCSADGRPSSHRYTAGPFSNAMRNVMLHW